LTAVWAAETNASMPRETVMWRFQKVCTAADRSK